MLLDPLQCINGWKVNLQKQKVRFSALIVLAGRVTLGFFITLGGVSIYSLVYTLNDYLMTSPDSKSTPPKTQCLYVGGYSTLFCLALMIFISIPTLSNMPLADPAVLLGYFILILSAFGHNVTYFELVSFLMCFLLEKHSIFGVSILSFNYVLKRCSLLMLFKE